jgi:hypothetical protein
MSSLNSRTSLQSVIVTGIAVPTFVLSACLLGATLTASAAQILVIVKPSSESHVLTGLETAADFYGLTVEVRTLDAGKDGSASLEAIRNPKTLAVVIIADALPTLNRSKVLQSLQSHEGQLPLLIAGINEQTSTELLKQWSSEAVTGCHRYKVEGKEGWYAIAKENDVTRQLAGSRLPLTPTAEAYFTLDRELGGKWLIEAKTGATELPVFARVAIGRGDVFFAAETHQVDIPVTPDPHRQQAVFANLAPSLLFLHYAAGEHAWHSPGDYANFTIDDLWLREPYGHVNYEELLQQAQLHDFHATVAFIPWNFDRSRGKVISLFREHPDRLSICVHGNDHIHQEFGPLDTHPLNQQTQDLKQALARMERFHELTGIPYDAVMVFPHSVAPESTFAELRRYNYLATANSLNVPSDASAPPGADFALRTATLGFEGFPSLRRYSVEAEIPSAQLAIDAFLGNPMLFYAHESFFASGIGAFNKTADAVNTLQPATQWQSLGEIARHLYLERLRDDGNYDIRAYSGTIKIANGRGHDAVYFIEKDETFAQPLTVLVDGRSHPFERSGSKLRLKLAIRNGTTREIAIRYANDLELAKIDISKKSLKVNLIRLLSDFRDNEVSNTKFGRSFIRSYADNGRVWNLVMAATTVLLIFAAILWSMRKLKNEPHPRARVLPVSKLG